MASRVEFSVSGLKELDAALKAFPAKLEARVLRGAVRAGGKVLEDKVRENVPVDKGALRESIRLKTANRRGRVSATVVAGSKEAYYARFVEFGTAAHFIRPKNAKSLFFAGLTRTVAEHPGTPERPFMRPALDEGSPEATEAFAEYVRARIAKEQAKL